MFVMNDCKKKLPIGDAPIKYIMRFYVPLMISFQSDDAEGWFCSSYILTKVKKTNKLWMVYQNSNPFVKRFPLPFFSSRLLNVKMLKTIIKFLIDKKWYIFLNLDFFYVKNSDFFQKKHYHHSVLLHGYDEQNNIVSLCGYCFGAKIKSVDISIEDFLKAFFSCQHNQTWVYKRRKKNKDFNKRFFYLGVRSYATSSCPIEYQLRAKSFSIKKHEYYGIKAHSQLQNDLKKILEGTDLNLTLRLYSYLELTRCMVRRLDYVQKNEILKDTQDIKIEFINLSDKYSIMLNLFLKYRLNRDLNIISKIINMEKNICLEEQELYSRLYKLMKKQYNYKK